MTILFDRQQENGVASVILYNEDDVE